MSKALTGTQLLEEETIVDVDVHLPLMDDDILPYLDEPHKSRMKHTVSGTHPVDGWDRRLNGKIPNLMDKTSSPENIQKHLCEKFSIDYPILNTFDVYGGMTPKIGWAKALMEAHNDLLLDNFLDEYDHFKGLATISTQDPNIAAEEIDRLGNEDDIVGLYIHNTGPRPPLGDPSYDVMWDAADKNNLNVALHGSANGFMYEFPRQNHDLRTFTAVHTLAHPWSQMLTLTSLITEGIPEKFPDLKFTFCESGITWLLYTMWRLNEEYSKRRSEVPLLEKQPEEYMSNFYVNQQPIEEPINKKDLSQIIDILGTENLMFATDFPHWDFDNPSALASHLESEFTQEEREQVLYKNAAEVFNLSI